MRKSSFAIFQIFRARGKRSSHGGDTGQMIFDPWSDFNPTTLEVCAFLAVSHQSADPPWMWERNTSGTLGTIFNEDAEQKT